MATIMRFVILGDDKGGSAFDSFAKKVESSNKAVDRSNTALKQQSATADASVKSFGSLVASVSGFSDVSRTASRDAGMVEKMVGGIGVATGIAEPLMAGLVVAIGGLAAAAAPAMAGLGAYGLVLKNVSSTVQQLDTLQKAAATGSPKAVAALQQFTKGLSPSFRAFAAQLTTSKAAYGQWAAGLQAPVVNPITKLLKLTGPALKSITPLARAGAGAVAQLMGEIGKKVEGGGLDRVVSVLLPHVQPVIVNLGHAIGNIVAGIWGVLKAFLPMADGMTGGVARLTAKFREWGQSLPSHTGFQSLMSMFRGQTPMAIALVHNLALIIKNLAGTMTGLASPANSKALQQILVPLSAIMVKLTANQGLVRAVLYFMLLRSALVQLKPAFMGLKAGYDVAAGIGKVGAGFRDATVAADAASGVWGTMGGKLRVLTTWLKSSTIAQKAFTVEMWLFDAASSANVIGVIVIALIALGAAFYLAWTKSATFRKFLIGLWHDLLAGARDVWNWLKKNWPLLVGILTGPVGIAVMVIIRYWRQITGAITGVFSGLAKPVAAAFDAVKSVITGGFDKWWASHGAQIKQVWSGLWKAISAVFHFFWDPLAAALRQSVAAFAVIFSVGLAAVRKVVSVYLAAVLVVFRFYIALWSAVFKTVFAVISALAIGFFKLLQAYAKAGLATVQLIFQSAWAVIQGIVRIALAVITTGAKIAFALWKALFKTAFDVIVGIVSVALSLLTGHWSKAWHDMLNTGKQIWNNMRAAASAVVSALSGLWNTALSTAKSVWNKISGFFGTWWKGMKNAFSIGVSAIGRIWDGVKNAARIPIAFIINTVYDKGIVPVVNAVGGLIGLHLNAIRFAKGGRVREGTTSTADDVLARISKNETVVSAAHSKVLAPAFSAVGVPGYAAGGIPNPLTVIGNVASSALHGLESLAGNALASAAKLLLSPLLNAIPGTGTPIGKDLKKIPDTIISKVLGLMKASQFTSVAGIPYLGTTLPSLATMIKYFGPLGDPSRETSVPFAGHSVTVNKVLAGNVQAMGGQVGAAGYGPYIRDIGGFRTSKGASGGYIPFSMHQFGAAFDINEDGGPNGNWNTMTLPAKLVAIMSRNHWFCGQSWGGGSRDAGHFQFTGGGGAATGVGQAIVAGGPQMYAKSILSRYGWGPGQMDYLIPLWNQESGWRWNAMNPSSGAYGIPQSLPGSKMASAGADWRTNPDTQIRWGESYIKGRYGSPAGAWAHEKAYNWYDRGSWKVPSTGPAVVHAGEMILPADAAQRVRDSGGGPLVHIGSVQVKEEADMAILAQKLSFAITAAGLGGPV